MQNEESKKKAEGESLDDLFALVSEQYAQGLEPSLRVTQTIKAMILEIHGALFNHTPDKAEEACKRIEMMAATQEFSKKAIHSIMDSLSNQIKSASIASDDEYHGYLTRCLQAFINYTNQHPDEGNEIENERDELEFFYVGDETEGEGDKLGAVPETEGQKVLKDQLEALQREINALQLEIEKQNAPQKQVNPAASSALLIHTAPEEDTLDEKPGIQKTIFDLNRP
jgi:hypothetical protein